jgi:hypothetical protein
LIGGFGLGQSVGVEHDDRVQKRPTTVIGINPAQVGLDEFDTGHPAILESASKVRDTRLENLE